MVLQFDVFCVEACEFTFQHSSAILEVGKTQLELWLPVSLGSALREEYCGPVSLLFYPAHYFCCLQFLRAHSRSKKLLGVGLAAPRSRMHLFSIQARGIRLSQQPLRRGQPASLAPCRM
jgi:hypothetical protein